MKVEIVDNDLLIVPETEFESEWLQDFKIDSIFHKTGISSADYLGIKIKSTQYEISSTAKNLQMNI